MNQAGDRDSPTEGSPIGRTQQQERDSAHGEHGSYSPNNADEDDHSNEANHSITTGTEHNGAQSSTTTVAGGSSTVSISGGPSSSTTSPNKKRRKVNHACIYCRRSHMTCDLERPCMRCIKRNIGHLCRDEPREFGAGAGAGTGAGVGPRRGVKGEIELHGIYDDGGIVGVGPGGLKREDSFGGEGPRNIGGGGGSGSGGSGGTIGGSEGTPVQEGGLQQGGQTGGGPGAEANGMGLQEQQYSGYNPWGYGGQNPYQDMHTFHPSFMFNAPEVTNEFNLLNDFLSNSLLDDANALPGDQSLYTEPLLMDTLASSTPATNNNIPSNQLLSPTPVTTTKLPQPARPASAKPLEKARETYYFTAADPSGSDTPEVRMRKLLDAKVEAGMLRPFNYVKGYARLNHYMDQHMKAHSRQKILRQLNKFRPYFRERMKSLTDSELVVVEMWFEQRLMEYDRVFASMAVPACCWRRTGEIFRGNKEMAELIHVPIDKLRDGKLAIHEIILEDHLVSYWEKFGSIAFTTDQKVILTSCTLKSPESKSGEPKIDCCFSFTVQRDEHQIPSLIVGNFLPIKPDKRV
ncbi:hypothetical protein MMC25_006004 [Agyrium rufum]|nr:hypothetical protein [Agyrium rufum]